MSPQTDRDSILKAKAFGWRLAVPLIVLSLFLPYEPALAVPLHGLSLYGPEGLKYKPGQPFAYVNPAAPKGGTLNLGEFGAFTKLNPASLKGALPADLAGLLFQTAMTTSSDDEPYSQYGSLVETADLADDGLSLTYGIYENARFSDGHPVTADDFVFSFGLRDNPEYHPIYRAMFKDVERAEKLDERRVRFVFKTRNPHLPLVVGNLLIFPKHVYGEPGKAFGSDFDRTAVGSGPYAVEKYEFGKFIALKRIPNWWGKDLAVNRGRFNFDRIVWKIYYDPAAMREAFKSGEFDVNAVNSSKDWALEYKGSFRKKGYYLREEFPHKRVAGMQGFVMNLRRDIFKSRMVRAAVSLAFDFDWSGKNLFYGQYLRNECYFDNHPEMKPAGLPQGEVLSLLTALRAKYGAFVPQTVLTKPVGALGQGLPLEQNVRTANQILDRAGWRMGADGVRVKDGQPLRFALLLEDPEWMRISEPYKNNLRKLGVDMEIKLAQPAEYEEKLNRFNFDMVAIDYPQSRAPGIEQRNQWGSASAKTHGTHNYAGIQNPAVDELIETILQAQNRKEAIGALQAMDRILTHQFYIVPHWYIPYDRLVYWNKFSRPPVNPSQSAILSNVAELWWEDKEKAEKLKKARASRKPMPR